MADERDPKVSGAYRALGAEEPPRALDEAILAAARREAGARPGFAGRAGRNRWYAPLATAAVLVLAVAVSLHTQVERPDLVEPAPPAKQASAPPAPARADAVKEVVKETVKEAVRSAPAPKAAKPAETAMRAEPQPFPAKEEQAMAERQAPAAPQAAAPAPAQLGGLASRDDRASRAGETGAAAPQAAPMESLAKRSPALASVAPDTAYAPERELERIAGLRAQGRHDEADRALAEFRKRYADYRIPEEMRVRVERR